MLRSDGVTQCLHFNNLWLLAIEIHMLRHLLSHKHQAVKAETLRGNSDHIVIAHVTDYLFMCCRSPESPSPSTTAPITTLEKL